MRPINSFNHSICEISVMSWPLQAVFVLLILSVAPLSSLTKAEEAGTFLGCKGNSCCAGVPGKHGRNGIPGRPGPPGPSGLPGRNGLNGHPGPQGLKGEPGETGRRGRRGHAGEPGRNGTDGQPGWRGKSGPRGPRGAKGPPGEPGNPGAPGGRGPPGESGVIKNCQCGRNSPTQVFFLNSGYWISERYMLGFKDVRRARGHFHLRVLGPVTYVLHVGGDWVNNNDVTLQYRLRCTHRRRTVFLPNEKGHRIYKFREQNRLESETFTYVTTELNQTGRWHCHLQISKGYIRSFYRWDSQYGEISLAMW